MAEEKETIGVRRAKLDSLKIFEITENELDTLEKGSNDSIFLNFGIFLLSTSISFFIVLLTVDFFYTDKDDLIIKFITFLCVTIFTFLASIICLIAWWRNKDDFKSVLKDIKDRMEVEKVETDDEESTATE
jgi:hypothetical protein